MSETGKQTVLTTAESSPTNLEPQPQYPDLGIAVMDNGTYGGGVTLKRLMVDAGEDVMAKIVSFTQGISTICSVLSVFGTISSVTLRNPRSPAGITYEGRFTVLQLNGLFPREVADKHGVDFGTTIAFSDGDANVMAGLVAGPVIAESPVQILMCIDIQMMKSSN